MTFRGHQKTEREREKISFQERAGFQEWPPWGSRTFCVREGERDV